MNNITATIKIDKDYLYNEIAKRTSYIGAKSKDSDAYDRIFTTDDNAEYFEGIFNLAYSECIEMLYPFTKKEIHAGQDPPMEDDVTDLNITVTLPEHFSSTTVKHVNNLVNEYIICRMMADWMMAVNQESHTYWIERYTQIRRSISIALTARTEPLKRKLRPF